MKIAIIIVALTIMIFSNKYTVSQKESKISFSIIKLLFINVDGEFTKFTGDVNIENGKFKNIKGEIDTNSVLTDSEKRDTELKAFESMLYVSKYPNMSFETISFTKDELVANLTIKDITKKVTFDIEKSEITDLKVEISISAEILRETFNLSGFPVAVDSEVNIFGKIVAFRDK